MHWAMGGRNYSDLIVVALIGVVGTFLVLYAEEFVFRQGAWCIERDRHCVRDWIGALSGWAAAFAASITIGVLLRQVVVARHALDHAKEASQAQLRAYVGISEAAFSHEENTARIVFRNFGSTPAGGVLLRYSYRIYTSPNKAVKSQFEFGSIVPGQEFAVRVPFMGAVFHRSVRLMATIEGECCYNDIFGGSHSVEFARVVTSDGRGTINHRLTRPKSWPEQGE